MGTRQDLETKLTPAAKQALQELVDDYRDQLLFGAADSASRLGDLREIAIHDIMASLNTQQSRLFRRKGSAVDRLLRIYMRAAVLLGLIGLGAYMVKEMVTGRGFQEQLFLLMALAGLSLSGMAYLMLNLRTGSGPRGLLRRPELDIGPGDYGSYLALWSNLELALRRAVAVHLGESVADVPLSRLLDHLQEGRVLSAEDQLRLRQLLHLRNTIAHGLPGDAKPGELALAAREGARLLERLRSLSGE